MLRRVVRVEPLQNLLPILPALLVGSQAAGVQAGAGTGAGTAPAALMTDAASQLWKADADGVHLARPCCFCMLAKLHGISRGRLSCHVLEAASCAPAHVRPCCGGARSLRGRSL